MMHLVIGPDDITHINPGMEGTSLKIAWDDPAPSNSYTVEINQVSLWHYKLVKST